MGFVKEFKEFAVKGNMVDLAIGVIIGAAFGKVVSSLVSDVLMPPLGLLLGEINFNALSLKLTHPEGNAAPVEIKYGQFINNVIDFIIVALVIFIVIKAMNRLRANPPPPSPTTKDCPECTMNIPLKAKKCPHCCSEI